MGSLRWAVAVDPLDVPAVLAEEVVVGGSGWFSLEREVSVVQEGMGGVWNQCCFGEVMGCDLHFWLSCLSWMEMAMEWKRLVLYMSCMGNWEYDPKDRVIGVTLEITIHFGRCDARDLREDVRRIANRMSALDCQEPPYSQSSGIEYRTRNELKQSYTKKKKGSLK